MRGEQCDACRMPRDVSGPSPRARGADPLDRGAADFGGPSPRARGAGGIRRGRASSPGTIPACAGSSHAAVSAGSGSPDHPRVRGEQRQPFLPRRCSNGPSPRARGAGLETARDRGVWRTIPACAGSSCRSGPPCGSPPDHPRVRGEQDIAVYVTAFKAGPSPRARGAAQRDQLGLVELGTIPACAGSRGFDRLRRVCGPDHPRVRGEQEMAVSGSAPKAGPSPRARGAGRGRTWRGRAGRTIPACARSRKGLTCFSALSADHPRVRGEQLSAGVTRVATPGPSLRARGAGLV